jgi:RNA polymerase sigma-70 factor (ECF subfamily)
MLEQGESSPAAARNMGAMASITADEAALVSRARLRDRAAFGALVSRYREALERILSPIAGDRETARDLVQDAALRAFKNLHRYREGYRFSTWFFRIGINLAISSRRRERLDQRVRESSTAEVRSDDGPLERLMVREDLLRLKTAVAGLPERYQKIVRMRYGEELGCKEIAERLGTTPNTVSIVLFRAKQRLKEELELP